MYFALLGKHKELSLKELEYAHPKALTPSSNPQIVLFNTVDETKLAQLAGIIKWGKIIEGELSDFFDVPPERKILGIADKQLGINMKKTHGLKRFKQVDLFHTDLEVKKKGIELIKIGSEWGSVIGYQQIRLYEVVDFEKPGRSMQMGMMPAKLTHLLLNIGCSLSDEESPLIYDPFVGSGTTGFLANYFGLDFLGSDLKLTFAEKNQPWWMSSKRAKRDQLFEFFLHDATKPLDNKQKFGSKTPLIITEGWLGPIIKEKTTSEEVKEYQRRVKNVYLPWIDQMAISFPQKPVMVFTIPWYLGYENLLEKAIIELASKVGFSFSSLQELYKRDQHKVGRKIILLTPSK